MNDLPLNPAYHATAAYAPVAPTYAAAPAPGRDRTVLGLAAAVVILLLLVLGAGGALVLRSAQPASSATAG